METDGQVVMRMPRELAESIAAGPTGALTFIAKENGLAYGVEGFGNLIRDAARAAGVRKPPHGLRKFAAMAAALAGATIPELDAMFGWTDGQTAMHYIRAADRERLGLAVSAKMENKSRTSTPIR
jgi:integrase